MTSERSSRDDVVVSHGLEYDELVDIEQRASLRSRADCC